MFQFKVSTAAIDERDEEEVEESQIKFRLRKVKKHTRRYNGAGKRSSTIANDQGKGNSFLQKRKNNQIYTPCDHYEESDHDFDRYLTLYERHYNRDGLPSNRNHLHNISFDYLYYYKYISKPVVDGHYHRLTRAWQIPPRALCKYHFPYNIQPGFLSSQGESLTKAIASRRFFNDSFSCERKDEIYSYHVTDMNSKRSNGGLILFYRDLQQNSPTLASSLPDYVHSGKLLMYETFDAEYFLSLLTNKTMTITGDSLSSQFYYALVK